MPPSPASPTILRSSFLALTLVLLAGCATTDPKAALPAVQQQVAARSDLTVDLLRDGQPVRLSWRIIDG